MIFICHVVDHLYVVFRFAIVIDFNKTTVFHDRQRGLTFVFSQQIHPFLGEVTTFDKKPSFLAKVASHLPRDAPAKWVPTKVARLAVVFTLPLF